jgi:CBS domain-containing protein
MNSSPITCRREDALDVPAKAMWDGDFGCVPVVDEGGHAVGMITDRDIAMATYLKNLPPSAITVESTVSRPVISCLPTDSLAMAEQLMRLHQVRRLAVVNEFGALVGILTQHALIREALNESRSHRPELSEHEVMRMLHAIGSPHGHSSLAVAS